MDMLSVTKTFASKGFSFSTSILDLLVREGVIVDDNWSIARRLIVENDYEKGNPYCEITIKDL